ncbi:unnamed protein product [Malus baccata var. baccata]
MVNFYCYFVFVIVANNFSYNLDAVLTYRHELGMNYDFIRPDLIVGSCLQTPKDVDKLRSIGVKTIFCLQKDSDLETSRYFSVDIGDIREYANTFDDIEHLRAEIRDFDSYDLRLRLPVVVSKLYKAINRNGGVTYVHCTAGLGRAPAAALFVASLELTVSSGLLTDRYQPLAYMFWVQGYKLTDAVNLLLSKRACFPKLDAIKNATADILTSMTKRVVTLTWGGDNCSTVEISGLDIGWGQRIPLEFNKEQGSWILKRELPEGRYEYKYVIDGGWTHNKHEPFTSPNKDGHVNNYVHIAPCFFSLAELLLQVVEDDPNSESAAIRKRMTGDDPHLTTEERLKIRRFLESCPSDE